MAIGEGSLLSLIATFCTYSDRFGRSQPKLSAMCGKPTGSDGVWDVDEDVAQAETRGQEVAEAADAEGLGGVVTGRQEVHAGLARAGHHPLGGLAGEERVEARGDRVLEVVGAGPGDDADGADPARAVAEG